MVAGPLLLGIGLGLLGGQLLAGILIGLGAGLTLRSLLTAHRSQEIRRAPTSRSGRDGHP